MKSLRSETRKKSKLLIGKREDSLAVRTRHREEMLQDTRDALAQFGCEVAED